MLYEIYDKPCSITYELLDSVMAHGYIELNLESNICLYFEELEDGLAGHCDFDELEIMITVSPNLTEEELIRTILHEMVHGKQWEDGEINFVANPEMTYKDYPWEIEAHELEQKLWLSYYSKRYKNTKRG